MTVQLQIYGDELDDLYATTKFALDKKDAGRYLQKRTEATPDYSKDPFTVLLVILAIDKTIDIIKDIVEERRRARRETHYKVSIDGGNPEEITPEELIERLKTLGPEV